jgi:ankyrin repeat protein
MTGYTPLHLAVQSRRLEVVNLILSHPLANVNCKDKDGNTPHGEMERRIAFPVLYV